ncbi:unnamed protein product [Onchocerca ochengi]|uniref:Gag_p30 domain-containing protein n=1 Tax=Onchocerca ochengi TaxID=42157 RepID=A0A182ESS1_ONCOC|nr:unnamed protein product [Onchocerca ochengi]
MRLGLYINTLEETNRIWLEYIQKITDQQTRKEEENKYGKWSTTVKNEIPLYHAAVNLPQLPLPTFNGDPKSWRQFWSSFKAAVHLQNIPDIQKLNYLMSCLNGDYERRNDREWKTTIETMERILRQLDAAGENLQHSSIEIITESKLPAWILDKVYQLKKEQEMWKVDKLRQFLTELVQRNEDKTSLI